MSTSKYFLYICKYHKNDEVEYNTHVYVLKQRPIAQSAGAVEYTDCTSAEG